MGISGEIKVGDRFIWNGVRTYGSGWTIEPGDVVVVTDKTRGVPVTHRGHLWLARVERTDAHSWFAFTHEAWARYVEGPMPEDKPPLQPAAKCPIALGSRWRKKVGAGNWKEGDEAVVVHIEQGHFGWLVQMQNDKGFSDGPWCFSPDGRHDQGTWLWLCDPPVESPTPAPDPAPARKAKACPIAVGSRWRRTRGGGWKGVNGGSWDLGEQAVVVGVSDKPLDGDWLVTLQSTKDGYIDAGWHFHVDGTHDLWALVSDPRDKCPIALGSRWRRNSPEGYWKQGDETVVMSVKLALAKNWLVVLRSDEHGDTDWLFEPNGTHRAWTLVSVKQPLVGSRWRITSDLCGWKAGDEAQVIKVLERSTGGWFVVLRKLDEHGWCNDLVKRATDWHFSAQQTDNTWVWVCDPPVHKIGGELNTQPAPTYVKCAPGCTPASPCKRSVCPVWREPGFRVIESQVLWAQRQDHIHKEAKERPVDPAPRQYAPPELHCELNWACGLVRTKQ